MGNKIQPPNDDESKSHHAPYLQKMFELLKELKQSYVEDMYLGIRRLIAQNVKSGDLSQTEKDYWRAEYWCENKNVRLYSILKVAVSPYHYFLFFDKTLKPIKPVWVYCIQNVENTDSMTIISQCTLCVWSITAGDNFTMEHFRRIRAEYTTWNQVNHICAVYKDVQADQQDKTLKFFEKLDEEKAEKERALREKEDAKNLKKAKSSPNLGKNLESKKELKKAKSEAKLGKK